MTFEQRCGSAIFYPTTDWDPLNMDPPKNAIKFKLSNKTSKTKKMYFPVLEIRIRIRIRRIRIRRILGLFRGSGIRENNALRIPDPGSL